MIATTTEYKTAIAKSGRHFKIKIVIDGKTYTQVNDFKYKGGTNSSSEITFGDAVSAFFECTLLDVPKGTILKGRTANPYIGLQLSTGIEWVAMGVYVLEKPVRSNQRIKITAYDNFSLCYKGFFSNLKGIQKIVTIINEQCGKLGISFAGGADDVSYDVDSLQGLQIIEVFARLAAYCGRNAVMDRAGKLKFVWYTDTSPSITPGTYAEPLDMQEEDTFINRLECATGEEKSLSVGAGLGIQFTCPGMTQERLNMLYNRIKGFIYRAAKVSWKIARPDVEAGDLVSVLDKDGTIYKIPLMDIDFSCDGGFYGTVESKGKTEEEQSSFKGPLQTKVDNTYSDLVSTKKLVADTIIAYEGEFETINTNYLNVNKKLSAYEGEFEDLKSKVITSDVLNTELAKINTAIIRKADIADLTAISGKIEALESNVGTINTLISGSVTAGSTQTIVLNAENTTIANALIKSAMIDSVTANKITAGIIDASSIHFKSKSGNMDLFDNTFLIKDATRERVQIGKDATGDYNIYVWDKTGKLMFDATGVTADGIQRPIIRNDMVSPNANIDGGKINIVSLVTEINNGTTKIESSHVLYDGKSLDVAFNSMETVVTDTSESLKTLSTQFAIEQGKVSTLITESSQTKQDLTEAKGNISTLRTDYSSLQQTVSGLNITVGQHTSSITKVQNDFDNLQIGSRNLIKKSSFDTFDKTYWTATSGSTITTGVTDPNGGKRALHLKAAQANSYILLARSRQVFPSVGVYSLSIWLRGNKTGKVDVTLNSSSAHPAGKYKTCEVTTIWQKFTLTCDVDDLSPLYDFVIGGYNSWTDLSFELDIAFPMLVASNKPSEWMPAPEDIETEIKTVSDKQVTFDASLNGFVGRVSSVESTTETLTNKTDTLTTEISSVSSKQASLELNLKNFKTEISETYVKGDTFKEFKTSITQTTDNINLEVSKKVNETSLISSINLSPEELKIHTSRLILEGDALNKCNNPAFTNGVSDDWYNLNGVYYYKDASFAPCVYAGITKSDGTAAVYGEPFVVAQGTQYYLECDVNYLKVSTGFTIALLCYDKYLKNPSFVPVYQQSPIVGWGNVRGNVMIPINKRYAKIVCYSTVGAIHHFSNVIVKNKVGTDLIVDGAITASKVASNEFIAMLNNSTGGYAKLTGNSLEFYENSLAKKTTSLKKGRLNFYRGYDGALQSFFTDVQLGSNKLITGTALNSAKAPYFFDFGRDANMRDDESSYNAKVQLRIVFEDIPAGNGLTTSIPKGVHIYDAPLYAHNKIYCSSTLNMGNNAMFTHKSKFDCIFSKDDAMVIGFDDTPLHIGNIATRSETSATINTIVQVVSTPGVIVYGYLDMKQNTLWNAKFQGCTTVSDIKYKKNIERLNDVAWLDEITINTYDYTNCDLKDQIGIIANDYVAKPYAKYFVATDKNGDLSVDYFALSNANIAYSQQNKRRIKDIEQCIVNSHQEFTKFKNECNQNINELTNKHQQELQNLRNEYNQKLLMMENKIEQLESRLD